MKVKVTQILSGSRSLWYTYILPAAYYHLNLDVTKENLLAAGVSAVPAVFLVLILQQLVAERNLANFGLLGGGRW